MNWPTALLCTTTQHCSQDPSGTTIFVATTTVTNTTVQEYWTYISPMHNSLAPDFTTNNFRILWFPAVPTTDQPNAVCSNSPLQVPPSPNTWNRFYGSSIDGLPVRPAWHFYTPSYQQHCKCFSVHHFCVWIHQACSSLASALWYNAVAHGTYMRGTNSTSSVTAINLPSIQSPTQPL